MSQCYTIYLIQVSICNSCCLFSTQLKKTFLSWNNYWYYLKHGQDQGVQLPNKDEEYSCYKKKKNETKIRQQYDQLFQCIICILAFSISIDNITKQKYQRLMKSFEVSLPVQVEILLNKKDSFVKSTRCLPGNLNPKKQPHIPRNL